MTMRSSSAGTVLQALWCLSLSAVGVNGAWAGEPTVLGVLEAAPDANAPEGASATTHLRLAFQYQGGQWMPVCGGKLAHSRNEGCSLARAADRRDWHVRFNGRELATVQTQGWRDSNFYAFTGALTVLTSPLPGVKASLGDFSTWGGEASRRPLVAVTRTPPAAAKAMWQREPVAKGDALLAWPLFKASVPTIPSCDVGDDGLPRGPGRPSTPSDMEVFDRIRLPAGGQLLGVRARQPSECDEAGGFASDQWFVKPARGAAFALNTFDTTGWPYRLSLVDIGAFALDGSLQAVFFYAGYNEDGYVIYYDGFRRSSRFTWGYH
jgi:hypothetical protein